MSAIRNRRSALANSGSRFSGSMARQTTSHWSARYIGIPFTRTGTSPAGANCWGLVRLVYRQVAGIDVTDYGIDAGAHAAIAAEIGAAKHGPVWFPVKGEVRELDVAVFRHGPIESHVGLVVAPGRMLHVSAVRPASVEAYDQGRFKARLTGFWRHLELGGAA